MRVFGLSSSFVILSLLMTGHASEATSDGMQIIHLRAEASVMNRVYTLGDIAGLDALDPSLRSELSEVEIGSAPRPGQSTQITRSEIAARLEQVQSGLSKRLRWVGPNYVRIRGAGTLCSGNALQLSAEKLLLGWLQQQYERVSIYRIGEPDSLLVPAGEVTFHPKLSGGARLAKRMSVWVDVRVDGVHFQTIPVWFAVSVQAPVWVATKDLEPEEAVDPNDFTENWEDIAGLSGPPLVQLSLAGMRTVRRLKAGAVVTKEDLEPAPAVAKGELITVYVSHGAVALAVKGIALGDGQLLQNIEVKSPSSQESYHAVVIGKSQAKVN